MDASTSHRNNKRTRGSHDEDTGYCTQDSDEDEVVDDDDDIVVDDDDSVVDDDEDHIKNNNNHSTKSFLILNNNNNIRASSLSAATSTEDNSSRSNNNNTHASSGRSINNNSNRMNETSPIVDGRAFVFAEGGSRKDYNTIVEILEDEVVDDDDNNNNSNNNSNNRSIEGVDHNSTTITGSDINTPTTSGSYVHATIAVPSTSSLSSAMTIGATVSSELNATTTTTESEPKKKKKKKKKKSDQDEQLCPICLEGWSGTGSHQICCLSCGHLFGKKCIEKWLKDHKKCPKCMKPTKKNDVRLLFVDRIAVVDTSEKDNLLAQLEKERTLRRNAEAQRMQLELNMKVLQNELAKVKKSLAEQLSHRLQYIGGPQNRPRGETNAINDGPVRNNTFSIIPVPSVSEKQPAASVTPPTTNTQIPSQTSSNGSQEHKYAVVEIIHTSEANNQAISSSSSSIATSNCDVTFTTNNIAQQAPLQSHTYEDPTAVEHRAILAGQDYHDEDETSSRFNYVLEHTISTKQSRVFDYAPQRGMLLISGEDSVLGGYRAHLTKVSVMDPRHTDLIRDVHTATIRDVKCNPNNDNLILTGAMDKNLKLTSAATNTAVLTYETEAQVWSCAWNAIDTNYIYCGLNTGVVLVYDIRQTRGHLARVAGTIKHPVHSLQFIRGGGGAQASSPQQRTGSSTIAAIISGIPANSGNANMINSATAPTITTTTTRSSTSGLLVGTLGGIYFVNNMQNNYSCTPISLPGSCSCVSFHYGTQTCLSTFRNTPTSKNACHTLFSLNADASSCRTIQNLSGFVNRTILSRSIIFSNPLDSGKTLVCSGDEGQKQAILWDTESGEIVHRFAAHSSPVLDVKSFSTTTITTTAIASAPAATTTRAGTKSRFGYAAAAAASSTNNNEFVATLSKDQLFVFKLKV